MRGGFTRNPPLIVALAVVLLVPHGRGEAQTLIEVGRTVQCGSCRLDFSAPVHLHGTYEDGTVPHEVAALRQLLNGHVFAIFEGHRSEIYEFGTDGRQVGRPIGRRGDGPGEFQTLVDLAIHNGRLFAFDLRHARISVLNPATRSVVQTISVPTHQQLIVVGGRLVLSGMVRTREAAGFPIHVHALDGMWLRSFGVSTPASGPLVGPLLARQLEPIDEQEFWAATINQYRIERWTVAGQLRSVLVASRPTFEAWTQPLPPSADYPPQASLTRISVDEDGLLWVIYHVPASTWRDAVNVEELTGHGYPTLILGRRCLDAVLEVIDPQEGALLARHEFQSSGWRFAGPRVVYRTWVDEAGVPRAFLQQVDLLGR
jgi:hypothetical protein